MAQTSTDVKITVDTSDIDIKFTKSVEQLNASLTKSQRALALFYNEQGLLTNGLGQCVEGLSNAQIKLGQYTDELGNIRTFQGGFTEGLSRTQLALGMYADEVGNVYNAMGELVGQTDKAAKELEDLRKTAQESANKLGGIGDRLDTVTAQLGGIGASIKSMGDLLGSSDLANVADFVDNLSNLKEAAANIKNLSGGFTRYINLVKASKGVAAKMSAAFTGAFKAIGGPLGVVLAGIQLFEHFFPTKEAAALSDEFIKIEDREKKPAILSRE